MVSYVREHQEDEDHLNTTNMSFYYGTKGGVLRDYSPEIVQSRQQTWVTKEALD